MSCKFDVPELACKQQALGTPNLHASFAIVYHLKSQIPLR